MQVFWHKQFLTQSFSVFTLLIVVFTVGRTLNTLLIHQKTTIYKHTQAYNYRSKINPAFMLLDPEVMV